MMNCHPSTALDRYARTVFPRIPRSLLDLAISRLEKLAFFSEAEYRELNPGARGHELSAHEHALLYGASGAHALFKASRIACALGGVALAEADPRGAEADNGDDGLDARVAAVSILVSSRGNVFMREIAEDLAADFESAGMDVSVQDETSDMASSHPLRIIVAPHEFFTLGEGRKWMTESVVSSSFMFNTEQLQTPWFAKALPALLMSRGMLDLSPQAAGLFAAAGVPAMHFEPRAWSRVCALGESDEDHPLFDALPAPARGRLIEPQAWPERAIDVSFFGTGSARRDAFFGRCAALMSRLSSFIYYRRASHGPIREGSKHHGLTRIARHVAAHSKISLNVHQDDFRYFEWHRMIRQGMASGALVVTDPCLPHPCFKPGQHFFQEELRHLPDLLEWLLLTADGRGEAACVLRRAGDLLSRKERSAQHMSALLGFLSRC